MIGSDFKDERDCSYCPLCGSDLEWDDPWMKCPEHGIVNIQFWESNWEEENE